MDKDTTRERLTPCASLAALGQLLQQRDLFGPVRDLVKIEQKTVKHSPTDKLYDALIAILSGAHGLVEEAPGDLSLLRQIDLIGVNLLRSQLVR